MKIARTYDNALQLRRLLRQPGFVGTQVWEMSDEEVFKRAERVVEGLQEALPKLAEAGRLFGESHTRSVRALGILGKSLALA